MSIPSMTRDIDNIFTHTWYEIKSKAVDNVLDSNVVTAALRDRGCFKSQVGGLYLTETIRYGTKSAQNIKKGSILSSGETELETMAKWEWRYFSSHVQRSKIDDQKNNGKLAIKKLVSTKIQAAKEALEDHLEDALFADFSATAETTDMAPQGLNEMIPVNASKASNTYGGIDRSNSWWQANYDSFSDNPEVNLLSDMKSMYNECTKHKEAPNLIIASKSKFEIYEEFAMDMTQMVQKTSGRLADLGYTVLQYKGADLVWVPDATIADTSDNDQMLFLNTNYISMYYDPQMWFDMDEWKPIALQTERIAHILCACNLTSSQLRRHGRLYAS